MFNKVILVGNLTRDIELRYSQSGMGIANTAIATSRKYTSNGEKKEEVCFVDITFFARSAEIANQYLRKGSKILVEGRLNFDQWVDQNGQKRSKHSVVVETMQMLDSKGDNPSANAYPQDNATQPQTYAQPAQQQQSYQAPQQQQQQNYNKPPQQQQSYGQQQQQPYGQPAQQMPNAHQVPEIDIDEDEIPF
ncbi:single-stranded DNA-binding protein [Sulfurimonas lithotrophica]|uniref:Single-stranded DNA-binding protein n=1 Tax=Sulfurimonas lithotrophica TaxID=2590022 RepID=A0A5P8NYT2_9BACT|nr:single-stranded DNA-binding protein [Sulfurimonas lithotrophica]QFR48560.1 single-stranded DNA-binding protein [Sulfurimonas lithotrophica]